MALIFGVAVMGLTRDGAELSQTLAAKKQAPAWVKTDETHSLMHKKCLFPTIMISSKDQSQCSTGVVIRSDKVSGVWYNVAVTCCHCADDELADYHADIPEYDDGMRFKKWQRFKGVVYAKDAKTDLAVFLFVTPFPVDVAEVNYDAKLTIGTPISHVGCGIGGQPRFDTGAITSLSESVQPHPTAVYRTSAHTVFGDSGGPLFHQNKVVGIMQAVKITRFHGLPQVLPHISYAIPVGAIKTWDGEENNRLRFLYTTEAALPAQPFAELAYAFEWPEEEEE